jgi:hypothetical protein
MRKVRPEEGFVSMSTRPFARNKRVNPESRMT